MLCSCGLKETKHKRRYVHRATASEIRFATHTAPVESTAAPMSKSKAKKNAELTEVERQLIEHAQLDGRWWVEQVSAPPAGNPPAASLQPASREQSRVLAAYATFRALFAPGQFTGDGEEDSFADRVVRALEALCDALASMRYDEAQSEPCKTDTAVLVYDACCKLTSEVHFPASLMRFLFRRYVLFPLNLLRPEESLSDEDEEVSVVRLKAFTKDAVDAAKKLLTLWGYLRPNGGWMVQVLTTADEATTALCEKLAELREIGFIDDEFALALRSCIRQATLVDTATKVRLVDALEIDESTATVDAVVAHQAPVPTPTPTAGNTHATDDDDIDPAPAAPAAAEEEDKTNADEAADAANVSQTAVLDDAASGFAWNDSLFNEWPHPTPRQRTRSLLVPVRQSEGHARGGDFTGGCAFDPSRPSTSSCAEELDAEAPVPEQGSLPEPEDARAEAEQRDGVDEEREVGPEGDASSLAAILANLDQDLQRRLQENRQR